MCALTPKRAQVFRQIEFIRLSDKRVLLIIVTPDGDVQNRILFVQRDYAESELLEAGNFFNMHFAGKSFNAVRQTLSTELAQLREDISRLMQAAVEASAEAAEDGDAMVISGERKLLDVTDIASDMDRLRKMFSLFEKKTDLLQLLDVSSRAQGVQIYIGGDSQLVPDGRSLRHHRALRGGRQGGGHAGRDRPDAHGVRARHSHRGHHGASAVQRPQPQSVGPIHSDVLLAEEGEFLCFFACSSTCGLNGTCRNPSRTDPFNEDPAPRGPGKVGVLLVNLGTPDTPGRKDIRKYLGEFLSDPRVIEIPRYLWKPILRGLVPTDAPRKLEPRYAGVWMKEGSPLMVYSRRQADGVRRRWPSRHGCRGGAGHALRQPVDSRRHAAAARSKAASAS